MDKRHLFGKQGEQAAETHLERNGYRILARNVRTRYGEIDLVAMDRDTVVFVEVKSRRGDGFGSPKAAVDFRKQRRISKAALSWLKKNRRMDDRARFDVVAVSDTDGETGFEIIQNAFLLAFG